MKSCQIKLEGKSAVGDVGTMQVIKLQQDGSVPRDKVLSKRQGRAPSGLVCNQVH